jgi:hypothetical protein
MEDTLRTVYMEDQCASGLSRKNESDCLIRILSSNFILCGFAYLIVMSSFVADTHLLLQRPLPPLFQS